MSSGRLRIGKRELQLSRFLKALLNQEKPCELTIAASWYHDRSILPPYIALRTEPPNRAFRYEALINLETLELIGVYAHIRESETTMRRLKVDLSEYPSDIVSNSITHLEDN